MKRYIASVLVVGAVLVAAPVLASSSPSAVASKAKAAHPSPLASMGHVTGTVATVGASSFTVTTHGKDAQTITVDFGAKTELMDLASVMGAEQSLASGPTVKAGHVPHSPKKLMSALQASDLSSGVEVSVTGTKDSDGSIQALLVRTVPAHLAAPKHANAKPVAAKISGASTITSLHRTE